MKASDSSGARCLAADIRFPFLVALFVLAAVLPIEAMGQEAVLDLFPLRPFSFDVSFNDRSFAPTHHTPTFGTDQHSLYANPRWNNFIDLLDFHSGKSINHLLYAASTICFGNRSLLRGVNVGCSPLANVVTLNQPLYV